MAKRHVKKKLNGKTSCKKISQVNMKKTIAECKNRKIATTPQGIYRLNIYTTSFKGKNITE